jgi:hypothetical protein
MSPKEVKSEQSRDEILGHKFDKRLKSFPPGYSQSFYKQILEKIRLYSGFKNTYKKSAKQEKNSGPLAKSIL